MRNRLGAVQVLSVAALATIAAPAAATPNIAMESAVFVEKIDAGNARRLKPARTLKRGDRVVTIVSWHRLGGDGAFVITNPLPRAIAYQDSAREDEEVSVDGGRTWGRLGELKIGSRIASPEDVTHVRWRIPHRVATTGTGHIAYSGIVR
jgi:hypothetical protein